MLRVEGLTAGYGRAQVLFGIDLEVPAGAVVSVMGRNGVGKTTLLNTVMGVLPATGGRVLFDGADITRRGTHARVRGRIGYVPQGHGTFPQLTVEENLLVAWEATGRRDPGGVAAALGVFPRLRELLKRRAGFLSGGQQQQLAIARALVTDPRLLVLDEPTEGIQPSIVAEIEEAITTLHQNRGLTVLLVEQYLDIALRLADAFTVIDRGSVVRQGGRAELRDGEIQRLLAI
ncbi:urea ABC transporter ATP-binding subunit UrtE [Allonocardiopsis opalescens]|uniref:Urea ABC transporter ATP-binding protein n=1 Tax=Allonocardiopsis opalescens TaxID=1144618 RepID=A0A2T0Q576_9ACTN|nr:urea ABC transporter ATP-binding subunit UrtE [Allonocardiopsis opalescens]PRX98861.1 urea ABC transporter ATP-binding protein [Allonocardiopsis opalescens]